MAILRLGTEHCLPYELECQPLARRQQPLTEPARWKPALD